MYADSSLTICTRTVNFAKMLTGFQLHFQCNAIFIQPFAGFEFGKGLSVKRDIQDRLGILNAAHGVFC